MKDWQRQPKRKVKRDTCLGGAGQSGNCNHCYQTEQMFCFHGRFDGLFTQRFSSRKGQDVFRCEAVRKKVKGNE
jgi:hypothetical protein